MSEQMRTNLLFIGAKGHSNEGFKQKWNNVAKIQILGAFGSIFG